MEPGHLVLSDRATISLPYHKLLDGLEEDRLGDRKFGSTRRGISPTYADKYMKKTLRPGDLLHESTLRRKVEELLDWKNMVISGGYGHDPVTADEIMDWLDKWGKPLIPFIRDTTDLLSAAIGEGKSIIFEAQLGALRDIDFGIYPFTSASTTLASYAPVGAGIPFARLDESIGIMKAYSSCVGEGPFPCELFGSCLALTKLDVLSYMERIPVCVAYELHGERIDRFPANIDDQNALRPVYEYMPGFHCDISACRALEDLPSEALDYIRFIERSVGCPIRYVSVGAEREAYICVF